MLAACESPEVPPPPPPVVGPFYDYATPIGPQPAARVEYHVAEIRNRDSFSTAAARIGVTGREVDEIVRAFDGIVDFTKSRPGHWFEVEWNQDHRIDWLRYHRDPVSIAVAIRDETEALVGFAAPVHVRTATVTVAGRVDWSLYAAMDGLGETPWLTLTLVDIFAWDIDFFTETQKGDAFRIVVEKRYADDRFIGYGNVLAAEYAFAERERRHRALRYVLASEKIGYYTEDGKAVEKAFLKSPIKFASITSRYGLRRHPILKYVRAHRGVDYGAPRGTAVWSVGDGVVAYAGRRGGYGRVVFVRHKNGLQTRYAHLRGFGPGIRKGRRVAQKQVVGYVGKSGLATGPHLHFEVLRGGRHLNPLRLVSPPAPPIPKDEMERFRAATAPWLAELDAGVRTSTTALR